MMLRDHPAITSKFDMFRADPRLLQIEPGFNIRDLDQLTPERRAYLDDLKADIKVNGIQEPLEVRLSEETIFVTHGHCRMLVVRELIEEGFEDIKSVPIILEPKRMSDAERTARQITKNKHNPLLPLEIAGGVKRLDRLGWSREQIAEVIGVQTLAMVDRYLDLAAAPAQIKEAVSTGEIAATTAVNMIRKEGPLLAEQHLEAGRKVAQGRGKSRITASSLGTTRKKRTPAPEPVSEPAPPPPGNIAKFDKAIAAFREIISSGWEPDVAAAPCLIPAYDIEVVASWLFRVAEEVAKKES